MEKTKLEKLTYLKMVHDNELVKIQDIVNNGGCIDRTNFMHVALELTGQLVVAKRYHVYSQEVGISKGFATMKEAMECKCEMDQVSKLNNFNIQLEIEGPRN
jgi:hypothetical protein